MFFLGFKLQQRHNSEYYYKSELIEIIYSPDKFCDIIILDGKLPRTRFTVYSLATESIEDKVKELLMEKVNYFINIGNSLKQLKKEIKHGKEIKRNRSTTRQLTKEDT